MNKSLLLILVVILGFSFQAFSQDIKKDPDMATYSLDSLVTELKSTQRPWLPFMQGQNVLTGLYIVQAGSEDKQSPHDTDEVYYVAEGKGKFVAGEKTVTVQAGSILFVKAEVEHRFFDIEEDLVLVVFFDQ